jgi:Lrp/AsnC family transcriptional regulator for asnA, asnC and gidA
MKFDETDIRVIRRLQRDARTNFADIAQECDVSVDTIIKRFQRLKRIGIVKGTTILLDPRHLGLECAASLEIGVDPKKVNDVVNSLRGETGVIFCTPSVGMQNVFAIVALGNVNELNALIERTKTHPNVKAVTTSIWAEDILLCPENFELEGLRGATP